MAGGTAALLASCAKAGISYAQVAPSVGPVVWRPPWAGPVRYGVWWLACPGGLACPPSRFSQVRRRLSRGQVKNAHPA